jgi:hypothetical protein
MNVEQIIVLLDVGEAHIHPANNPCIFNASDKLNIELCVGLGIKEMKLAMPRYK